MLTPIVCQSCGMPVGDVEDLFRHMKDEVTRRELEARGTVVEQAAVDPGLKISFGPILDKLGIHHNCCRVSLISAMSFCDYY
jgi:DNA-directed RNA polymerase subunit N (RpoN/RPB10)